MNLQTYSNLQFRPLLKTTFRSVHFDLGDKSGENYLLYLSVSLFSSRLRNVSVLTAWFLLCPKLQFLLMLEEISGQSQKRDDKFCETIWVAVAGKRQQAESFQQNL